MKSLVPAGDAMAFGHLAVGDFGVIGGFSPQSTVRQEFEFLLDGRPFDMRSADFELGFIVRGRQLGGDWGVSFVQKKYRDGSVVDNATDDCSACDRFGSIYIMQRVQLRGVSIHKFTPIVTIKRRTQIGLTFGGGVAQVRGAAERHEFSIEVVPGGPPITFIPTETISHVNARDLFLDGRRTIPVWKVDVTAAALVGNALKLRVGGGLNFTNYPAFTVAATYLIGSK